MALLKKTLFDEKLETYNVLVEDTAPFSTYFKITELPDTLTGGKNGFLIQGSPELVADSIIKIQIKDSQGNTIYNEPGEGIPEYYEGTSKVVAVYIYPDTSFGPCTITILGELKEYYSNGVLNPVPLNWEGTYNVRWQKQVNVNPFLANTSKIRFYRRPKIDIVESVLPIFNRNVSRVTISGSVNGTPISPSSGEDYRAFNGVTRYELSLNGLSQFSESMEREVIQIVGLNKTYSPTITDVTSNKKAFVDVPYYITASSLPNYYSVTPFSSASYTMSYDEAVTLTNSSVNTSFATINITDLETFTGDTNRIKVYASSKNDLGDFQLLEDVQLESNELLLTASFANQLNVRTGLFTNSILSSFWTSSAIETGVTLSVDNSRLLKSALLTPQNDNSSSVGLFKFYNLEPIEFTKNTEYQLDFTPLLSAASDTFGGIEIYMSGSSFIPTSSETNYGKKIGELITNTQFKKYDKQQINFKPDADGIGNLVYVIKGGVWHISDISLRAAQESSFSPNEITLTVNVPVKINNETFDFKFELYDINNNYVPIILEKEFTFTGGNDISVRRDLQLNVSNNSFNFSTGSSFPQFITIDFTKSGLTGSVVFQSQSIDVNGNLITGAPQPGTLDYIDVDTRTLSLANFTGSSALGVSVGAITYTASCEDVNRYFTIFRIDQGAPARLFFATADKNSFVFDPDDRYKSDIVDDYIDIRLVRQNLPSFENEGFNITSGSEIGTPPPLHEIESIGNATVYRLFVTSSTHQYSPTPTSGSGYAYSIGQSHYDFKYDTVDGDFTSSVTIDAVLKGDKGKGLIATSDANQFFYKMTDLAPAPTSQTISILVKRLNLGSLTNTITVTSGSGVPALSAATNEGNGVTSFTISAGQSSNYQFNTGVQTYTFSANDLNGTTYSDEITISPVIAESQVSVNLTNENATVSTRSTGFVASSSFVVTSGSVSVKVGGEDITREEGLATNNRFDIISATGTNCTPNDTTPDDATYGITALSADSGSLSLVVRYKDGRGLSTDITKIVTYSKAKQAAPVLSISSTPKDQSVTAKSTGEQIDSFADATIVVKETYNGTTTNLTITSLTATSANISSISTTPSTGLVTLNGKTLANGVNSTTVNISAVVTDSEGVSRTVTDTLSLSKVKKAVPNVVVSATPQAQSVLANAAGTQTGTLTNVTVSALEGATSRFTSMTGTYSGFSTNPTISTNILTTTSAVMNAAEASATIVVTHTDSEGTSGQTQTIVVRFTKVPTGTKGDAGDNGAPGADGRRTATGMIFYQPSAATAPPTPSATSYTFSSNSFGSLTANWAIGAPTYTAGNTNKYWYSTYTAVETTAGGGTAVPTFSAPAQAINFTGLVTFTSANNLTDGTNVINHVPSGSIANHIGGANVTTIEGGKISTGVITSTGYVLPAGQSLATGTYTDAGTIFNLDNGSLRSKNFYIASNGDAFFKGNLTATTITAGLGYTPTTPTELSTGLGTKINTGAAAADVNNNVTTISGGKIRTGVIESANLDIVFAEMKYATAGTRIDLNNGAINSKNFYISSSGDAFFKGNLSGASGTFSGNIRIGSGESVFTADSNGIYLGNETFANAEFRVTPAGALTATSANITGTINATAGNFSGDITSTATITGGTLTGGTITVGAIGGGGTIINGVSFQDRIEDTTLANSVSLGPGGMIFRGAHGANNDNPTNYISIRVQENYARQITQSLVNNIEVMSVLGYPSSNQAAINIYNGGMQLRNYSFNDYVAGNQGRALQVFGNLYTDGTGTFTGDVTANTSDRRLKTNIVNIDSPLEKISKINGVYFNWNDKAKELSNKDTKIREVGFIAQEVQSVLPEIIKPAPFDLELDEENTTVKNTLYKSVSGEDYLTVQYEKIVPLLVECIKELKNEIEELKKNRI
jgi:hypothetical protein